MNAGHIAYDEHKKWFYDKIKDKDARLYIGEDDEGHKIGQARFEIISRKKEARINVNLNPIFFGKGIGNRLIRLATEAFVKERPHVKNVSAYIINNNKSSRGAFLKAGYKLFRHTRKGGKMISIFKFNYSVNR